MATTRLISRRVHHGRTPMRTLAPQSSLARPATGLLRVVVLRSLVLASFSGLILVIAGNGNSLLAAPQDFDGPYGVAFTGVIRITRHGKPPQEIPVSGGLIFDVHNSEITLDVVSTPSNAVIFVDEGYVESDGILVGLIAGDLIEGQTTWRGVITYAGHFLNGTDTAEGEWSVSGSSNGESATGNGTWRALGLD